MKKNLIIINGVTGAIGSSCLSVFSRNSSNTIYGLSRKAPSYNIFLRQGTMPDSTLICSTGNESVHFPTFAKTINFHRYDQIVYIHALGIYPFEIQSDGMIRVQFDQDGDGIDDRVMKLSHDALFRAIKSLEGRIQTFVFGGLSDIHKPAIHQSWWKTMEKIKSECQKMTHAHPDLTVTLLDISSVICPHELITRPFVFARTNAIPSEWLTPDEVAREIEKQSTRSQKGFHEMNIFHSASYYHDHYYQEPFFTERKKRELGIP